MNKPYRLVWIEEGKWLVLDFDGEHYDIALELLSTAAGLNQWLEHLERKTRLFSPDHRDQMLDLLKQYFGAEHDRA